MKKSLCAALFSCLCAAPASAAMMQAVYTGTVFDSVNRTGEFGVSGLGGLDGLDYLLTFVYDISLGQGVQTSAMTSLFGGPDTSAAPGTLSPVISSSITINGVTRSFAGESAGSITLKQSNSDAVNHSSQMHTGGGGDLTDYLLHAGIFGADFPVPLSLTEAFDLVMEPDTITRTGIFGFYTAVGGKYVEYATGQLDIASLKVTKHSAAPSPIPLPAPALLLVTAFAGVALLRQRRAGHRQAATPV